MRGRYTAVLTVTDSSGKTTSSEHGHHGRQHEPDRGRQHAGRGRHCSPSATTSRSRSRSPIRRTGRSTAPTSRSRSCSATTRTATPRRARPAAPASCTPTPATSSHGGNVFGVDQRDATPTTASGTTAARRCSTTSQNQIRQKHQEVEFVVNQSGTNTATNTDGGRRLRHAGVHRGSLAAGDWIQLNGPFNLFEHQLDHVPRRRHGSRARPGSPLAAVEIRQDSITGPIVQTNNLVSTGDTTTWTTPDVPDLAVRRRTSCSSCSARSPAARPAATCSTSTGSSSGARGSARPRSPRPDPCPPDEGGAARGAPSSFWSAI